MVQEFGRKDENGVNSGIYIPTHHDQEDWQEQKTARNTTWKEKQKNRDTAKRKAANDNPATKEKDRKLSLSNIFKTTLTTQFMLLDAEANHHLNNFINGAFYDASKMVHQNIRSGTHS